MIRKLLISGIAFILTTLLTQTLADSFYLARSDNETNITLPDVPLHDSYGNEQRLPALFQDHTVIVNFIFTTCNAICPVLGVTMKSIEEKLKDRLGKKVILVSISVDPINDSPEKLRAYSKKLGAGSHWYWLTGRPADINQVLRSFGIATGGRPEDHPPVILIGNMKAGKWLRWIGIPSTTNLMKAIDNVSGPTL